VVVKRLSKILDDLSEFLAARKGLVPMIGIIFILVNLFLQFIPGEGVIVESNLLFHLGVILAVFGLLLARTL
jgi:hypothetical protein